MYHVMIIVTGGFSNKFFIIITFGSSSTHIFKTGVIRNVAMLTGKHLCWSLFVIKLQVLWPATLFQLCLKRDRCFPVNTANFLLTVFL